MKKALVSVGYHTYVLDTQDALRLLEIMCNAEIYEEKWRKDEDGGALHYVYPQDSSEGIRQLRVIPDALYKMAKLAGKPEKGA
jgi:hypothetical protein